MWNSLEKSKILTHTRDIGNAKLYKLNTQNSHIKILIELFDKIINTDFQETELKIPA